MPSFKLPKPKKRDRGLSETVPYDEGYFYRKITVPANKELIDSVKAGDDAEILLKGKVTGTRMNEPGTKEITIEVEEVCVYGEGEFEKLAKDDDDDE